MDGLVHIAGLVTWTRKNRRIASAIADREHGIGAERGEAGMSATEKVVNDLNVSKLMLCNPKMLTSEMCVRIGQAINGAIDLLKEQEPVKPIISYGTFRCGNCGNIVGYNDGYGRGYQNNFCSECGKEVKWDADGETPIPG